MRTRRAGDPRLVDRRKHWQSPSSEYWTIRFNLRVLPEEYYRADELGQLPPEGYFTAGESCCRVDQTEADRAFGDFLFDPWWCPDALRVD